MSSPSELVPSGARVLLDTSVLLAHLSPSDRVGALATQLVDGNLRSGRNDGVISTITVGELLVRPHRSGREAVDVVLGLIWSLPDLLVRSVDVLVAAEAARMRALRRMEGPDSLILATAVLTSASHLATNDRAMATAARALVPEMTTLLLSDLAA